ncbi:hypothetical protein JI747_012020 [Chryseobacterium sp. RG1]|uniref:Uncharacterized protein n=1 Tax=Chryseobacterium tagetis TaxID=2801334 RepID=A0ABS8A1Q7_9FLAO|nr:hypothetical protein [Chryseobacterium tagetis]MCA6067911.1 hypothetical protein [Chryseobacterium tagetis]
MYFLLESLTKTAYDSYFLKVFPLPEFLLFKESSVFTELLSALEKTAGFNLSFCFTEEILMRTH